MMPRDLFDISDFGGLLPLFPLPNVVLFPGVIQPLFVFEERYKRMLRIVQAGQQYLGIALLRPGWEKNYHLSPALYPTMCLGRVLAEELLSDGCSNILVLGLRRVGLLHEVKHPEAFRMARVRVLHDRLSVDKIAESWYWQERLLEICRLVSPDLARHVEELQYNEEGVAPLGVLIDSVAAASNLDEHEKQVLLDELDVFARARKLRAFLVAHSKLDAGGEWLFPPSDSPPDSLN